MTEIWKSVRALLFDVFGTVVDWRGSIIREGASLAPELGLEIDWAAFADAWRGRYQPAMERVRSGARAWATLDVLHRENLCDTLAEFGISHLSEAQIDKLNLLWHRLAPWPDSVAGLTVLKRDFIIAAQSNGNVALMVDMAKAAGLPWDVILGAEVVGHYKPQPQAYLRAVEMLGLSPGQCMMVAAHNDDLAAARDCGLRTAFVCRPTEHGPEQSIDLTAEQDWDVTADSLVDLADRLA